jgi:hypothetical protein
MNTVEIKAFVPARDFELKRCNGALRCRTRAIGKRYWRTLRQSICR